jgi:hypothetical protein
MTVNVYVVQDGHRTILIDEYEAARIGTAGIRAFVKARGKFTDKPNQDDLTSAMIANTSGPEAVEAFHKVVGHWSDWQNQKGYSAAIGICEGRRAIY